jgi:hypothetical protein
MQPPHQTSTDLSYQDFLTQVSTPQLYTLAGITSRPRLFRALDLYGLLSGLLWLLGVWIPALQQPPYIQLVFWNGIACAGSMLWRYAAITRRKPTRLITVVLIPGVLYLIFRHLAAESIAPALEQSFFVLLFVALYWKRMETEVRVLAYQSFKQASSKA